MVESIEDITARVYQDYLAVAWLLEGTGTLGGASFVVAAARAPGKARWKAIKSN